MKGIEAWWHSLPTWGKILVGVGGAFLVYMVVKGKGSATTKATTNSSGASAPVTGSDVSATDNGSGYSSGSGSNDYSWLGTSSGGSSIGGSVTGSQNPGVTPQTGSTGIAPAPVTTTVPKTNTLPPIVRDSAAVASLGTTGTPLQTQTVQTVSPVTRQELTQSVVPASATVPRQIISSTIGAPTGGANPFASNPTNVIVKEKNGSFVQYDSHGLPLAVSAANAQNISKTMGLKIVNS